MKYLVSSILLIVWLVLTFVLTITVIGILYITLLDDSNTWFDIPNKLLKVFEH